ncbi:hypothetical protein FKH18_23920 [Salmonella enterica]|uniref:Uncharacterized protein n=2 Tax=Salmonella enterica TaxID=28901 RepID=A0A619I3F1_SALER|nr:hypothetical protein [Salmonella enterica]EBW5004474.1 hypothetical protein [Salmonella enterica subsp. enterica serovar Java]ECJ2363437.1 hypothetical protein [Salmonella enterica subsp. diarizonae]EAV7629424.1 hypothetical protein [Salmonella enterica]EBC0462907.1 hypothetical protein [Salmonella enterica]
MDIAGTVNNRQGKQKRKNCFRVKNKNWLLLWNHEMTAFMKGGDNSGNEFIGGLHITWEWLYL